MTVTFEESMEKQSRPVDVEESSMCSTPEDLIITHTAFKQQGKFLRRMEEQVWSPNLFVVLALKLVLIAILD